MPGAGDPVGTEMVRHRVNGYMSKDILRFKKCSENEGAGEREWLSRGLFLKRVSGWVSCNGPVPQKPQRSVSHAKETEVAGGPVIWPARCLLHMWKRD